MTPRSLRAAFAALFAVVAACHGVAEPGAATLDEFDARLESARAALRIPGMTAVIAVDQRIAWSRGYGFADVEGGVAATDTTSWHLASLTKTFASTIIMQLVQDGTLDLDAPVSDFGITIASPGIVRVRHLMTHTSEGEPGSHFAYNGNRYALLDAVIRGASGGSTFAQLLEQRIIAPLCLRHTAPNPQDPASFAVTGLDRTAFLANFAHGYSPDGTQPEAYPSSFNVAAGLVASATDVARYSMAIDRNAFVSAATQAAAFTPFVTTGGLTTPYGLGWFVSDIGGHRLIWHYGYWVANSSLIIKEPARGLTFVLLANSDMLSRPANLGAGDLMSSRPAREFVNAFVLGSAALP
jgi:CubicO group peptidase (beta-lactamase class C family)